MEPHRHIPGNALLYTLLTALLVLFHSPLRSQTTNPTLGGPQLDYDPTPKALEMTRYGQLPVDRNSGRITFEIPLYTYTDQDFNIPVSLSYASSGFMPGRQTGEAGLGWTLLAGGAITREIIGVDDFYADGGRYYGHKTFSDQTLYSLGYTISYPAVSNGAQEPSVSGTGVETTSDIYHFSFPGHGGSFLLGGDCAFHAYDTNGGLGTCSIEYTTAHGFNITSADGFVYSFGSTIFSREYLVRTDPMKDSPGQELPDSMKSIVTWLLDKITAPDGRIVEFTYARNWPASLFSLPTNSNIHYDVVTSIAPSLERNLGTLGQVHKTASLKYTTYISSISVRESASSTPKVIATFSWEYKPNAEMGSENRTVYTKLAVPTKRLTSVSFTDSGRTLRTVSLSYSVDGTRSLLDSVYISGIGSYSMEYLSDPDHPLPGLTCDGVDYWGFWNGKTVTGDELHLEGITTVNYSYDESLSEGNTAMEPDSLFSRLGTLHKVTYPTGGSTTITCEAAKAERILLRRSNSGTIQPSDPNLPGSGSSGITQAFTTDIFPSQTILRSTECGGVRVASTTDYDATGGPGSTRTYSYSDGVIQVFNRYILGQQPYGLHYTVYNSSIHYPGSTFDRLHVAYGAVTATEPDGSRSLEEFTTWDDFPDDHSANKVSRDDAAPSGDGAYDLLLDNIFRDPDSRHYRRGLPKRTRLYSPSGFLLEDRQYTYADVGNDFAAYVVGSGQYWWSARRFICDRRLSSEYLSEHFSDGDSLVTVSQYSYDSLGRKTSETVSSHDGRTTTKQITYDVNPIRLDLPSRELLSAAEMGDQGIQTLLQSADYHYTTTAGGLRVLSSYTKRLYDPSGASASSGGMAMADTLSFSSFDACGNPGQQVANGLVTSLVWGHSGRYPVAIVKGVAYSSLPASVKNASLLTGNLSSSQVSSLRSLSGSEVTIWDYIPSVGASRCVSPSGRVSTYSYDQYGRLSSISLAGQTITSYIYDTQQRGNTDLKYIQTTTHGGAISGSGSGSGSGFPAGDLVSRVIYDGLGREWVTAEGPASGSGSSAGRIVSVTGYDTCGMKSREYLPFRTASSTVSLSAPLSDQSSWWDSYAGSGEGQYASVRYGYDNSLSPRRTWTVSPGSTFAGDTHPSTVTVSSNASGEVVSLRFNESTGSVYVLGMMPAGTLRRTTTVSPDGDSLRVFTDSRGMTVLERRFGPGGAENDTYFVQDRLGRTVWTISPVLAAQVTAAARLGQTPTYSPSGDDAGKYVFISTFDAKGDPASIKVPGSRAHSSVYDSRHLPALEKTPLMHGNTYSRQHSYDDLGRLVASVIVDSSRLEAPLTKFNATRDDKAASAGSRYLHIEGIWDLSLLSYGQAVTDPYAGLSPELAFRPVAGMATSYSNDVAGDVIYGRQNAVDEGFWPLEPFNPLPAKGLPLIFDSDPVSTDFASTASYYDALGRTIQQVTRWPDGGLSRTSSRRDLRGNVLDSVEEFAPEGASSPSDSLWIWSSFAYDDFGNVTALSRRAGTGTPSTSGGQALVSATYSYDGIGRLTGTSFSSSGIPSVSTVISQTVQGWHSSSQATLTTGNGQESLFSETLSYWNPPQGSIASPRYGGMVSAKALSRGAARSRTEAYSYDPLGRITKVGVSSISPASGGTTVLSQERFTYDAAGNILSIRRSEGADVSKAIDMSYSGNLLSSVSDSIAASSYSYSHDRAGNVTSDGRVQRTLEMNIIGKVAGVRGTVYGSNPLQYGSLASYAYLADGTKISALDTRDSTLTLYRGPFIMRRDSTGTLALDCILLPEGLVVKDGNSLKFIIFVKDCLGSVRDVVDLSDGTVLELDDYQAFGERVDDNTMQTTSINRWRFNAKEEQDSIARLPYLDYGARLYDPVIGRWLQQDPMATKFPFLSPYNFCGDNPVNFVDPDGKERRIVFNRQKRTITVYATYYYPAMESRVNKAVISAVNSYNNLKNISYDNNGIAYSVKFHLSLKPYYSKKQLNISPEDNLSSPANVIQTKQLRDLPKTQDGHQILGYVTGDKMNNIVLTTDTENNIIAAHEIGHTLGATDKETNDDFMYKFADNNTDFLLSQETINEIIENGFGVNEEQPSVKESFFSIIENLFNKKRIK